MRTFVFAAAISLFAASLPFSTYADPSQPEATAQATQTDPDAIVCKQTSAPTGTRIGASRECHSQREWDEREKDSQKQLMDRQMHGLQSCLGSCGG